MPLHPPLSCVMPTHQCWTLSSTHPFTSATILLCLSLPYPLGPAGMPVPASQACCGAASSPPIHGVTGSMRGRQRHCTPQVYKVVAILALLWLGILGSHALFMHLLWSNKSKKCVFIGVVACLSLITFLCVLVGLFYFSDWQWPPALQLRRLFCWCWGVFVDLWKWFSKNNI